MQEQKLPVGRRAVYLAAVLKICASAAKAQRACYGLRSLGLTDLKHPSAASPVFVSACLEKNVFVSAVAALCATSLAIAGLDGIDIHPPPSLGCTRGHGVITAAASVWWPN